MAVTEQARHRLYQYFEETMGDERAATMMELLPPVGWGDVATKAGVHAEFAVVKADIAVLKEDLRAVKADVAVLKEDVAGLKVDVAGLKEEMRGVKADIAVLKEDVAGLKVDVAGLKADVAGLKGDVQRLEQRIDRDMVTKAEFERTLRRHLGAMIGTTVALVGSAMAGMAAFVR